MVVTHRKLVDNAIDGNYLGDERYAMREYRNVETIAIDLETTGEPGTKDGLSHKKGQIAVVAIYAPGCLPAVLHYPRDSGGPTRKFMRFLEGKILVGHNITAFDIPFMMKYGFHPFKSVGWRDTLIAEQLCIVSGRRDLKKDLGTTLNRRLGIPIDKAIDHRGWGNEWLTEDQLHYVLNDVTLLLRLWEKQQTVLKSNGLEDAWELEQSIFPITANMIGTGMPLDLDVLDDISNGNEDELGALIDSVMESLETDAINSPKKIKAAFEDVFGVYVPNTTRDTLLKLSGRADEVGKAAHDVQKAREHKKRGMYNSKWLDKYYYNGRINARYFPLGTDTSRFASRDPNLQQIPSNMRGMFGYNPEISNRVLLKCDYCLPPNTKVLTTNLEWVAIGTLNAGDTLIGFDEDIRIRIGYAPHYKTSIVEKIDSVRRPCYRVTTDMGTIVASKDHMFVAQHAYKNGRMWIKTNKLHRGMRLSYAWKPWEQNTSYIGGYVAGILDGEGYLDKSGSVGYSQKEGIVDDTMKNYLAQLGYTRTSKSVNQNCVTSYMMGGEQGNMHLIGSLRPPRLLAQANRLWEGRKVGSRYQRAATILKIEYVGMQDTIAIQTSTKTFIAEGFLTHNSQMEVLIFAILTNERKMIEWYRTNRDVHTEVAAALYNRTTEEIEEDKKNGGTLRKTSKAAVFAMLFAGGKRSVIATARKEGIELSDYEASTIIRQFFRNFPQASNYISQKRAQADRALSGGYAVSLRLPNGPKRSLHGIDITASRLVNTMVQGTAAVGLKMGLRECLKVGIARYVVAIVHDEIVLDVTREEAETIQPILEKCMQDGMEKIIGIRPKVESGFASHWLR